MVDFPEKLPSQLLQLKWLRDKRDLTSLAQKAFIESIQNNEPLTDDQALILGQTYRAIKELEELPMSLDRGVNYISKEETPERIEG